MMTTMNATFAPVDVVVAGGGIGGLANAYALATAGYTVRVLERSPEFAEVGAGLQIAPNATRILKRWGLLEEVLDAGVRPRRLLFKDALDGAELTHLPRRLRQPAHCGRHPLPAHAEVSTGAFSLALRPNSYSIR
jgi:2-polyprenyl-6-methoxyphenol hydroxylase-like FAD-dependent oxidoreductase